MQYDIIIIGAGLGGLTAGAKLSKEGKKVLLIEQHYVPGGCATTFKRKGFTFEVGLHGFKTCITWQPWLFSRRPLFTFIKLLFSGTRQLFWWWR
ncbi:MAG: hypothetical protein B6I20_05705 [Bacteroidetes bacterium 4572_117]|nr:MAG: hypothetical protein B6I20_05705 [Bacteroidetes bacterium 4572_117]